MTKMLGAVPLLPVADAEAAAQFYVETMGFEAGFDAGFGADGYAIVRRDDVEIHLWQAGDEAWRSRAVPAGESPVASGAESFLAGTGSARIRVQGIEGLHVRCREAGIVHPNGPLTDRPWGTREFVVLDRDGNALTFFEPVAPQSG